MPKFVKARPLDPELDDMLKFWCPACQEAHWVAVGPKSVWPNTLIWQFNGDCEKPTINPSLLVRYPMPGGEKRCHSFIRDGKIQYLGDCTHGMAGKTVEIPDWPEYKDD